MSEHCNGECPLCRHKQSLDPSLHTQLPTLGAYVGTLARASHSPTAEQCSEADTPPLATADGTAVGQRAEYSQYVDPASIENEGFIFPERFLSEAERRKAIEYRKQYRSWRLKANRGSHGEFSKVVELMPERAELRPLVAPRKAEPPSVHAEKQNDGKQLGLSHDARTVVKEEDEPTQAWLNKGLSTGSDESPCPVPLSRFCSLSMLSSEISVSYTDSVIDARPAPEPFGLKRQHDLSDDVYGLTEDNVRKRHCAVDFFFSDSAPSPSAEEQLMQFLDGFFVDGRI